MKTLIIIPSIALFFSCGTQKELTQNADDSIKEETITEETVNIDAQVDPIIKEVVFGTVRHSEACLYIEAETAPGELKSLYPINLDTAFQAEGTRIKFEFTYSRAMVPKGCKAEYAAVVRNVILVREGSEATFENNYRYIGTVHLTEGGCGIYIDALTGPDTYKKLYPINLDEQFKVEGARIKFDYELSRAMMPSGCDADFTVTVSDVTRMRE